MFALVRVTIKFVMVAMALSLAACSKSGGGGGSGPVDPYQQGAYPPGYPNGPYYGPNGGPNGPNYGPNGGPNGSNGPNGGPVGPNGQNQQQRQGRQGPREIERSGRKGPTIVEQTHYQYQAPPAYVDPKEKEEEKEQTAITREVLDVTTKRISSEDKQAARTSTGDDAINDRTPWKMVETDGRMSPGGGLILKPGDPMIRPQNETGADSVLGASFTDSKEDEVMTYFRNVMKDLPETDDFREQSYQLAKRISLVDVAVRLQERQVSLVVEIKDEKMVQLKDGGQRVGETKNLRLEFKGFLNGNTHAVMKLVKTSDKSYEFAAVVYCIDKSNTCNNTIVELVQARNGRPCKQAFAVHRFGKIYTSADNESLGRFRTGSMNPQFVTFMEVVNNTIIANDLIHQGMPQNAPSPKFDAAGMRAFSVVEGSAFFNLLYRTSTSYTAGASNEVLQEHMVIAGPLLPSEDKDLAISSKYKLLSTNEVQSDPYRTGLAGKIAHAKLIGNNGRGNLAIYIEFASTPFETATLNILSLAYDTYNLTKFLKSREEAGKVVERVLQDGIKPIDQTPVETLPAKPAVPQKDAPYVEGGDVNSPVPAAKTKKK